MAAITLKQQRFADEYLIDLNATQAAIRAGYSEKTANEQGARLLANASIQEYISKRIKARQKRTQVTQDYVLSTILETIERCRQIQPVLDRQGNPIMIETPDDRMAPAFAFDAKNVLKGCELLGKHLGLFSEKVKHEFTDGNGNPITGINITVKVVAPGEVDSPVYRLRLE